MEADAPVFDFSLKFFFYLFHGTSLFPTSITNTKLSCHRLLGLIPPSLAATRCEQWLHFLPDLFDIISQILPLRLCCLITVCLRKLWDCSTIVTKCFGKQKEKKTPFLESFSGGARRYALRRSICCMLQK